MLDHFPGNHQLFVVAGPPVEAKVDLMTTTLRLTLGVEYVSRREHEVWTDKHPRAITSPPEDPNADREFLRISVFRPTNDSEFVIRSPGLVVEQDEVLVRDPVGVVAERADRLHRGNRDPCKSGDGFAGHFRSHPFLFIP